MHRSTRRRSTRLATAHKPLRRFDIAHSTNPCSNDTPLPLVSTGMVLAWLALPRTTLCARRVGTLWSPPPSSVDSSFISTMMDDSSIRSLVHSSTVVERKREAERQAIQASDLEFLQNSTTIRPSTSALYLRYPMSRIVDLSTVEWRHVTAGTAIGVFDDRYWTPSGRAWFRTLQDHIESCWFLHDQRRSTAASPLEREWIPVDLIHTVHELDMTTLPIPDVMSKSSWSVIATVWIEYGQRWEDDWSRAHPFGRCQTLLRPTPSTMSGV